MAKKSEKQNTETKIAKLRKRRTEIARVIEKFDDFEIDDKSFNKNMADAVKLLQRYDRTLCAKIAKLDGAE